MAIEKYTTLQKLGSFCELINHIEQPKEETVKVRIRNISTLNSEVRVSFYNKEDEFSDNIKWFSLDITDVVAKLTLVKKVKFIVNDLPKSHIPYSGNDEYTINLFIDLKSKYILTEDFTYIVKSFLEDHGVTFDMDNIYVYEEN